MDDKCVHPAGIVCWLAMVLDAGCLRAKLGCQVLIHP